MVTPSTAENQWTKLFLDIWPCLNFLWRQIEINQKLKVGVTKVWQTFNSIIPYMGGLWNLLSFLLQNSFSADSPNYYCLQYTWTSKQKVCAKKLPAYIKVLSRALNTANDGTSYSTVNKIEYRRLNWVCVFDTHLLVKGPVVCSKSSRQNTLTQGKNPVTNPE